MTQQYKVDAEVVLKAAHGRWDEILFNLAPTLRDALEAAPKHVACPVHGGENGFRFFKDYKNDGNCICNTCGAFDGLHILMKVNGWDFYTALKSINEFLQIPENINTDSEIENLDGKVLFAGMSKLKSGHECFSVRLKLDNNQTRSCWGKDLGRACTQAEVAVGDNVRVSRLGTRTFMWKGRQITKTLWTVRKMPSDAEKAEEQKRLQEESGRRSETINSRWAASIPVRLHDDSQKPLSLYLSGRGIHVTNQRLLKDMRYSASEMYFDSDGKLVGKFPCMICAVRDCNGELITLHRTFLTKEGHKIGFGTPKKLMAIPAGSTINGASIRFGEVANDGIVCVAEGVETALSVLVATGYPCLSTISAQGMTTVELPKETKVVFIFADKDKSLTGQKAAESLRKRLTEEGIPSVVCYPSDVLTLNDKGVDWNDVIRQRGPAAFPFQRAAAIMNFA